MEKKSYLEELEGIPFDSDALNHPTMEEKGMLHSESEMLSDQVVTYLQRLNAVSEVSIQLNKPLLWYIRSAETLYKQAAIYRREGDLEKAYILFMKYSILVLREMPKHGQYKSADHVSLISALKVLCVGALDYLEKLKGELRDRYSRKCREAVSTEGNVATIARKQGDDDLSRNRASWILRQKDVERFNNERVQTRERRVDANAALANHHVPQGPESEPAFTAEAINQKLKEASERFLIQPRPELAAPALPSVTKSCTLCVLCT
jgi:ubiquitin carboxyl-terminal hydrolase-like protein